MNCYKECYIGLAVASLKALFDGNNLEERTMQFLNRTPHPNTRETVFALSILIFFTTCLIGYNSAHAAGREDAPGPASSLDISGVWLGQLSEKMPDGRVGHGSLYLRLQQEGDHISGVAGASRATASPIENVVLSGKHLKFSLTTPGVLHRMELDANGDAMEGKGHAFRSSDNHAWDFEIKLARNK